MGQVIELSRGAERRKRVEDGWMVTLELTEGELLRVCELTARLAFVHHTGAQASKDAGDQLEILMGAVLESEPSERRRLAQRMAVVVREVPEAAKRERAAERAVRKAEDDAVARRVREREEREARSREHDERMGAFRRLPQERRDELLLGVLGDERLTIREWTARLNAKLDAPEKARPTVYPSTVTKMAKRMTAAGQLSRIGEQFQGKVRYRYARRHQITGAAS